MFMQSPLLTKIPGIHHGFGTRDEPIPEPLLKHWNARPQWKQVHGIQTALVSTAQEACGEVDILMTRQPEIPIAVMTADCVPIIIAHQSGHAAAVIHAGWRGTRARITQQFWQLLEGQGENPKNWVAAIGPAIGPCCYQVSEELIHDFQAEFHDCTLQHFNPQPRILDLQALHFELLTQMGFAAIDLIRACTRCSTSPLFCSYRRGDHGIRQYSGVMIAQSALNETIS